MEEETERGRECQHEGRRQWGRLPHCSHTDHFRTTFCGSVWVAAEMQAEVIGGQGLAGSRGGIDGRPMGARAAASAGPCLCREWQSNSAVRRKRGPRVLWPPPLELFVPHPCSQFKPDTRYASSTLCENEKPMKILNVGRTIFFHPQLERKNAAANITLLLLTITVLSEASKHPTNPLH